MSDKVSAGEAYVSITCNSTILKKGLQEVCQEISRSAKFVAQNESSLSPSVELTGFNKLKDALIDVRNEFEKTASTGKSLAERLVVTSGDFYNFVTGSISKLSNLLGGVGDQFDKMSARTGLSTAALSEYAHAANMCGSDVSNVEGAIKSMQVKIGDANAGSEKARKTFTRLGVNLSELSRLTPEGQFDAIANAVAGIVDPTERASAAMKIFGSDGQRLVPMFSAGAQGLRDLRDEAKQFGVSVDDNSAKMGANFVDATTRFKASINGLALSISRQITPTVTELLNVFAKAIKLVITFVTDHPAISKTLVASAAAVAGFTTALFVGNKAVLAFNASVTVASSALKTLRAAYLALTVGGGLASLPIAGWLALASAIALAGAALYRFYQQSKETRLHTEAFEALNEGTDARNSGRDELERLKVLQKIADSQGLSNEQLAEASSLAQSLRNKYGEIGVSVDEYGRKINVAANAQSKMNALIESSRIAQLKAAISEAKANESSGAIERDLARNEVGYPELLIGKKRGESWKEYLTSYRSYKSENDARLAILEGDQGFQDRVKAAREKNKAQIAVWEAELSAYTASSASSSSGSGLNVGAVDKGAKIVASFVSDATQEERTALDKRIELIRTRRAELIEELRKLADPTGEVDWNDSSQVNRLYANSPTARALQAQALEVDRSANAQIEREKQKEREQKQKRQIEDARKSLESVAAYEKRISDESKTPLRKKIDAIREETKAYQEQLQTLWNIERQKGASADQSKLQEYRQKYAASSAQATSRERSAVQDAYDRAFDKFATDEEKLQRACVDLSNAIYSLQNAATQGDYVAYAEALDKTIAAANKYESASDAVSGIDAAIGKSIGGTFSAWQASESASASLDKQLFNETRTQTTYLREIARAVARQTVAFQ